MASLKKQRAGMNDPHHDHPSPTTSSPWTMANGVRQLAEIVRLAAPTGLFSPNRSTPLRTRTYMRSLLDLSAKVFLRNVVADVAQNVRMPVGRSYFMSAP
jgi:hypothetical protein